MSSKPKDLRGLTMARKPKEPDKIQLYVAAMEANLERATGKTMAYWVRIARKCPHKRPSDRLKWLKSEHGLGLARAGLVLGRAFGLAALGHADPQDAIDRLFARSFAPQKPLYLRVASFIERLGKGTTTPRRGYVAFYRLKQFAAIKPSRKGLLVGLALKKYPKDRRLVEVSNLGGGDRNRMALVLVTAKDFDRKAKDLLRQAHAEG